MESTPYKSSDWFRVLAKIEELLKNQRDVLENPNKTYKERLISIGYILALKQLMNLPQQMLPHKD